jgi:hypothetical protein
MTWNVWTERFTHSLVLSITCSALHLLSTVVVVMNLIISPRGECIMPTCMAKVV